MKILDKYILKTYLKIFFSVFFILYFIFILQAFWLFIEKFAGKDLDVQIIIEFLIYYTPNLIPMVLPLSVLLAAIMSFGSLSEHYEFAAMKSAGISLQRAMKPLVFFIFILSGVSFWFANNISPKMQYKFKQKKNEIMQAKPAMAITEGQFCTIDKMNIKVQEKSGEKGEYLKNVIIHLKTKRGKKNKTIVKADSGIIVPDNELQLLKLKLYNGTYYEDIEKKEKSKSTSNNPFAKAKFYEYIIGIDLSEINDDDEVTQVNQTSKMMDIQQLTYTIDSLNFKKSKEYSSFVEGSLKNIILSPKLKRKYEVVYQDITTDSLLKIKSISERRNILKNALNNIEEQGLNTLNNYKVLNNQVKNINKHWLSFYNKFVIAFSCFLMFFIGAPLGAIIRKGGLGLPIVLAVIIFIVFHFVNTFGIRISSENKMSPFIGSWLSTIILLPLAIIFTYKAAKDRGINSFDNIKYHLLKWLSKLKKIK